MMAFGIDAALSQFRWAVNKRIEEEGAAAARKSEVTS